MAFILGQAIETRAHSSVGYPSRVDRPQDRREGCALYQWFVFAHLVGLVLFVFAHGTSAFTTYQIRTMRDPDVVRGYLDLSQQATRVAYVGLILLILGGRRRPP